jgi:hypothetical protein
VACRLTSVGTYAFCTHRLYIRLDGLHDDISGSCKSKPGSNFRGMGWGWLLVVLTCWLQYGIVKGKGYGMPCGAGLGPGLGPDGGPEHIPIIGSARATSLIHAPIKTPD